MEIGLYRRYPDEEAAKFLGITKNELTQLRKDGRIAYIDINGKAVGYFGHQLITFLLGCVAQVDVTAKPKPEAPSNQLQPDPLPQAPARQINPMAELLSIKDTATLLGIGRTKLYQLLNANELEIIRIGGRAVIRRSSINDFIERHAKPGTRHR